jgi:hypothetical protein
MVKCTACGGTYEPIGLDGLQYFHRCPPLSRVELAAAIDAGKVVWPNGKTSADYTAAALAANLKAGDASLLAADDWLRVRMFERANLRDENVKSTAAKDAGTMKANGAGTTGVVNPAPTTPMIV